MKILLKKRALIETVNDELKKKLIKDGQFEMFRCYKNSR